MVWQTSLRVITCSIVWMSRLSARKGSSDSVDALSSSTSIAIVGLGVRCAVGLAGPAAAAAVRAGLSGLREHPYMLDKVGEPMIVARDPTLDPALQGAERFTRLAGPALNEALAPLARRDISLKLGADAGRHA